MKKDQPAVPNENEGYFFEAADHTKLFIYDYRPNETYKSVIFIISGITGINHHAEKDIIEQLSNNENRVVVIHPRGTGYSGGTRGDISDLSAFITDYAEIITRDKDYHSKQHKIVLFGHSMSTAVLLAVADKLGHVDGAILVNPPYILKNARGMSPEFGEYLKYSWFYLFQKHRPIVNMAGDPERIQDEEDRKESESRRNDPLLVKYFSMHMMTESRKLMNAMPGYAKTANYPLLMIYGEKDNIVDRKGCEIIFTAWKHTNKEYVMVVNGSHGRSAVILSKEPVCRWMNKL
jgi:alpha-beta hydrolase superfamily lysophospholipase